MSQRAKVPYVLTIDNSIGDRDRGGNDIRYSNGVERGENKND